jgi:hypothetical protein
MGEVMNIEVLSERDAEAVILPVPAAAALPDAPLAMPTQRLEAPQALTVLRGLFGAARRTVNH